MYTGVQFGRFQCIQSDIFVVVKNGDVSHVAKVLKVDDDEGQDEIEISFSWAINFYV